MFELGFIIGATAGALGFGALGYQQGRSAGYIAGFENGVLDRAIERGDMVRLKSGGPDWTVTEVNADDVTCVRWTGTRPDKLGETLHEATFKRWLLWKVVA